LPNFFLMLIKSELNAERPKLINTSTPGQETTGLALVEEEVDMEVLETTVMAVAVTVGVAVVVAVMAMVYLFIYFRPVPHQLVADYGSYGGSSGTGGSSFRDDNRKGFEEYDAGGDEISTPTTAPTTRTQNARSNSIPKTSTSSAPAPAPAPEVDLLGGFGDDDAFGSSTTNTNVNKALPVVATASIDGLFFLVSQVESCKPIILFHQTTILQTSKPHPSNLLSLVIPLATPTRQPLQQRINRIY
jgi:hypothetical protein